MSSPASLLKKLNEISFAINDLTLFLDTHPDCMEAIQLFYRLVPQREQLLKEYSESAAALTPDLLGTLPAKAVFAWNDGPAPWEGGDELCGPMKNDCSFL